MSTGGYVFICPHCGKPWDGVPTARGDWFPLRASCSRCPLWPSWSWDSTVPGSILNALPEADFDDLPADRIAREYSLHMKHYQEKAHEEQEES